jgi:hypothetical protein
LKHFGLKKIHIFVARMLNAIWSRLSIMIELLDMLTLSMTYIRYCLRKKWYSKCKVVLFRSQMQMWLLIIIRKCLHELYTFQVLTYTYFQKVVEYWFRFRFKSCKQS